MSLFTLLHLLVFLAGVAAMEAMTWAMHRWVMHGPLWCWHRSHHQPGRSRHVWHNDLFALAYVVLAMALFWLGLDVQWRVLWWLALGVIAYGLLYVLGKQWDGRPHPTTASMCQSGSVSSHSNWKGRPP